MRPRRLIPTIAFSLLALLGAVPPTAAADLLQSSDGVVHLAANANGPRVVDRRGYSTPLALPEGVVPTDLAALRTGWLLAGEASHGGETELYLRRLDAGGLRNYPVPRGREGRYRTDAVLLTRDGELDGMVWLEGDDRQAYGVMASRWLGITWSAPVTVTPAGEGARLALDATVLDDGSWLLAWAGWDGEDDEIFVSLLIAERATDPQPLTDNSVPDVLPTVLAATDGAMLAWNGFDGDGYGVVVLRLREGRWNEPTRLETATYFPHLVRQDDVAHLLYFERRQGGSAWIVAELDDEARSKRRGRLAWRDNRRPVLERDGDSARLLFPPDDSAGAVVARDVDWRRP